MARSGLALAFLVLLCIPFGVKGEGACDRASMAGAGVEGCDPAGTAARGVAPSSLQVSETESRCHNALKLAQAIGKLCDMDANTTSTDCCNAVVASVEGNGCLCTVLDQTINVGSFADLADIVQLYKGCGGARQLNSTTMDCADVENYQTPPPSPTHYSVPSNPAPEPPSGESTHPAAALDSGSTQAAPSGDHESKELLHVNEVIMFFVIFIACTLGGIPIIMYYRSKKIKRVEGRRVTIEQTVETVLGARLPPAIQAMEAAIAARVPEIVAQAAARRAPPLI